MTATPETISYLKKLGVEATPKNLNDLKLQNQHADKVAQENYESALALAKVVESTKVVVKLRSGEGGRTFGSISTKEISAAAKEQHGLELDKKKDASLTSQSKHSAITRFLSSFIQR